MSSININGVEPVLVRSEGAIAMLGESKTVFEFLRKPRPDGGIYLQPAVEEKRLLLFAVSDIKLAYQAARANNENFKD